MAKIALISGMSGQDLTVRELAGQLWDVSWLKESGWQACITLRAGLTDVYREFAAASAASKAAE